MDGFETYGHALVSVAGTVMLWVGMGPVSATMKEKAGAAPGGTVPEDYSNPAFRWHRAYANLTESLPAFAAAVMVAVLAGASPFWVNLLASLFLVSRIAMAYVHVQAIGKPAGGLRSILFGVGWAATAIIAVFGILAVL